jgi:hypothetical protein
MSCGKISGNDGKFLRFKQRRNRRSGTPNPVGRTVGLRVEIVEEMQPAIGRADGVPILSAQ